MSKNKGIYLYCICQKLDALELNYKGLKGRTLDSLAYQDILAITSPIDELILDPTKENVFKHEEVNRAILKQSTLIPMSFGNIFKSKKDIVLLLKKIYPETKHLFPQLKNKIELGLKIFWDPELIIQEIAKENPHLKRKQSKKNIYNQLNIGKEISMFIENKKQSYINPILNKLSPLTASYKENNLIGDKMILNSAFLIDKSKEKAFDQIMDEIYYEYKDKLNFKYTGPWPPYNFVNIKIQIK